MKKVLLVVLSLVLVAALSVGLTMAYLTDKTEVVTNTFTVGNVDIDLDEAPVDANGDKITGDRVKANTYKLIPGHEYDKDPIIHVTAGSEKCYVFVKVENGINAYEAETEAGDGYKTIVDQIKANDWQELVIAEQTVTDVYYKEDVDASASDVALDLPVFANFKIDDNAQDESGWVNITAANTQIKVTGYAVQKDGLTLEEAWNAVKDK